MSQEMSEGKKKPKKLEMRSTPSGGPRSRSADASTRGKASKSTATAAMPTSKLARPSATSGSRLSGPVSPSTSRPSASPVALSSGPPKEPVTLASKPTGAASIPMSSRSGSGMASKTILVTTPSMVPSKDSKPSKAPFPPVSSANDSSAPSVTSSYKSLQTYDRKKRPIHFRRTVVGLDDFGESQEANKPGKHHMLILASGQGGTFAYGTYFRDENNNPVFWQEALKVGSTKIRHLWSYGEGVRFIGTTGCITCMGVYFEISGNRVFCAHVNAWMSNEPCSDGIDPESKEYVEIKTQFIKKLQKEAAEHGWSAKMVKQETLTLITPSPEALGGAIQDAIKEFLGMKAQPFTRWMHGFILVPGGRFKDNKLQEKFLGAHWGPEEVDGTEPKLIFDKVPDSFQQVPFTDSKGQAVQQDYLFTGGRGWHVSEFGNSTYL